MKAFVPFALRMKATIIQCFGASTRKLTMVFSPSALAASSRCRPSTSTKRAPSALTSIGAYRPLSRMLAAISFTRFCSRVARRLIGT
jgi:hypothetical protein